MFEINNHFLRRFNKVHKIDFLQGLLTMAVTVFKAKFLFFLSI